MKITITGKNHSGVIARLVVETTAVWVPLGTDTIFHPEFFRPLEVRIDSIMWPMPSGDVVVFTHEQQDE